jgi:hypothetical protein
MHLYNCHFVRRNQRVSANAIPAGPGAALLTQRRENHMRPDRRALSWAVSLLLLAALGLSACSSTRPLREERALTSDWKFLRGDPSGAEQPSLDDANWRSVDLPHDWSIEDLPARDEDPLYAVVSLVPGQWRLKFGDDPGWKDPHGG